MKKDKVFINDLLNKKRTRKGILRKKKNYYNSQLTLRDKNINARIRHEGKIIKNYNSELYNYFIKKGFIINTQIVSDNIEIPKIFSFYEAYNETIEVIKTFVKSIYQNKESEITVDFKNCELTDQQPLFVLRAIREAFEDELSRLNKRLFVRNVIPNINFKESKNENVNQLLFMVQLINEKKVDKTGLQPIVTTGCYYGEKTKKHYAENKKAVICTKITRFVKMCLERHGHTFNPQGINFLEGLISEILNNSEDHSSINRYYVSANFQKDENENAESVGEMNLFFLNFGPSYFEGLEENKNENIEMYDTLESLFEQVRSTSFLKGFTKDNLFTLYALQDGVSRLKFKERSRGFGTMKFINSFFYFGDYENIDIGYSPKLCILSGGTMLICNNKYKPFVRDGTNYLSLNKENSLAVLPEKSNLIKLGTNFPGTLLSAKIYLNYNHLISKFEASRVNGDTP